MFSCYNRCYVETDINECKDKTACQCPECSCKNTWGSYRCSCGKDLLYIWDHDTCISELHGLINTDFLSTIFLRLANYEYSPGKRAGEAKTAWTAFWVIVVGLALAAAGTYLIYKHRLRVSSLFCGLFMSLH